MPRWEYCELSPERKSQGERFYLVRYFSAALREEVSHGAIREEFTDLADALGYLGNDGWEAFHINEDDWWVFKRPTDWDEDEWEYDGEDEE